MKTGYAAFERRLAQDKRNAELKRHSVSCATGLKTDASPAAIQRYGFAIIGAMCQCRRRHWFKGRISDLTYWLHLKAQRAMYRSACRRWKKMRGKHYKQMQRDVQRKAGRGVRTPLASGA